MGEIIIFHKLHGITTGMFKQIIKLFLQETPLQNKSRDAEINNGIDIQIQINNYSSELLKKKQTKQGMVMLSKARSARDYLHLLTVWFPIKKIIHTYMIRLYTLWEVN